MSGGDYRPGGYNDWVNSDEPTTAELALLGEGPWLVQRRDEIERRWPDDEHLRMGLRQFDFGPWIYELHHINGRIEKLTEQRYRELAASVPRGQHSSTTEH